VRAALDEAGLMPALLELELTEAIIMKHGAGALTTLNALRALGVRLTIDDFGTGYSRLGYLKDYPVDKLKIDRSFIAAIGADDQNGRGGQADARLATISAAPVVTAIIAMARSLGMTVIAEGVETPDQLEFLRRQGCDQYQGVYARQAGQLDGLKGLLDN
jgi:EAL domain-containing protein (putative c-di-GMP-specific phosphodiesterase class I)